MMDGSCADSRRRGFSLIEALAAMTIAGLLAGVLLGILLAQLRVARSASDRALDNDAVRTTLSIMSAEARRAQPADVRALSRDSVGMRVFRGMAVPCPADAPGLVAYRGDRVPDPRKDSVLVVAGGAERALQLLDARPAPQSCTVLEGSTSWQLTVDGDVGGADVLLVFESGRYFLTARALRYRLGAEGRQPLTAEAFTTPATAFLPHASLRGIAFILAPRSRAPLLLHAPFAPPPQAQP